MKNASIFQQVFGLNSLLLCRAIPLLWSEEPQPLTLTWKPHPGLYELTHQSQLGYGRRAHLKHKYLREL